MLHDEQVLQGVEARARAHRDLLEEAGPAARVLVLFAASLADSVLFMQLASVFELQTLGLSPLATVSRAALNAGIGLGVYELVERWGGRERRERL